ncbi:MAG: transcriptional regulator [Porphyromonas sp.]|nr:transcriptional regulator [Bacteroidales bacterium]MDD7559984.1 transcriptional regulator [Bacteroidales bacterium]MDY3101477.1 transcriptional regulator [Porphyromonas sp.]
MKKELNPVIHSQLRLAVITILAQVEEADFNYLKDKTEATAGNLSVQLDKLSEAGYITITKTFEGKRPRTIASITDEGRTALEEYISTLKEILGL